MKYFLVCVMACLSATGTRAQDAIPTDSPDVKKGESWTYVAIDGLTKLPQGEWTFEVTAVDASSITVDLRRDGNTAPRTYGRDWSVSPEFGLFRFPLEIGKTWSSRATYEINNCGRIKDELTAEVKEWEGAQFRSVQQLELKSMRLQ